MADQNDTGRTSLHETADEKFRRENYGIRNVAATVAKRTNETTAKSMRYAGGRAQSYGRQLREYGQQDDESNAHNQFSKKVATRAGKAIERLGKVNRVGSRLALTGRGFNKAGARMQVAFTMGWTGLLNILSLATGIIALAAFGMTATIQAAIDATPGGQTLADFAAWAFGADDSTALWIVAIGTLAVHWFLVITMFSVAYLQLKFGGLEPLQGKMPHLKSAALISAFVISMIPGANFIPWIFIWLFVVGVFPN